MSYCRKKYSHTMAIIATWSLTLFSVNSFAQGDKMAHSKNPKRLTGALADYELAFEDNFNGQYLNQQVWFYRHGDYKYAGGYNRQENVSLAKGDGIGYLNIAYKKDTDYDKDGQADLSGGGVISNRTFGYGYYEARIKFYTKSKGLHQSFWNHGLGLKMSGTGGTRYDEEAKRDLRPTDNFAVEIDGIELDSYMNYGKTNYWLSKKVCDCVEESTAAAFNRFDSTYIDLDKWIDVGFEWLPGLVKFYIGGVERYRYSFTTPAYAAMEVYLTALANTLWHKGSPLPGASMQIDYFKYYNKPIFANWVGNHSFEFGGKASETVQTWIIFDGVYDNEKVDGVRVVYDGTAYQGKAYLQQDGRTNVPFVSAKYQLNFLPKGNYKLTAWVKKSMWMKQATMAITQVGGKSFIKNIPTSTEWNQIELDNVRITSDSAAVVFKTTGADGEWLKVDKVELVDKSAPSNVKVWPMILNELEDGYSESGPFKGSFNYSPMEGGVWGNAVRGYNGSSIRMSDGTSGLYAQWMPKIPARGEYDVYIYKPIAKDADNNAKIEIKHSGGTTSKYLDFANGDAGWVLLGTYQLTPGAGNYIRNYGNTKVKKILADAIAITTTGGEAPKQLP